MRLDAPVHREEKAYVLPAPAALLSASVSRIGKPTALSAVRQNVSGQLLAMPAPALAAQQSVSVQLPAMSGGPPSARGVLIVATTAAFAAQPRMSVKRFVKSAALLAT